MPGGSAIAVRDYSLNWACTFKPGTGLGLPRSQPCRVEVFQHRYALLASPFPARSSRFRFGLELAFVLKIERHRSADELLQSRFIDLIAFVDVDSTPNISFQAGVE